MSTIHQTLHTGPDGLLKLEVPTGLVDTEVAVTVLIEPAGMPRIDGIESLEAVAGKWHGEPLKRGDQGIAEQRNSLG